MPNDPVTLRVVTGRPELLQSFRVEHAIGEAGVVLAVTRADVPRFAWLSRYFPIRYQVDDAAPRVSVALDHEHPRVGLAQIERPLIFAHAIFDRYTTMWARHRGSRFSFAGLGTASRRASLGEWASANSLRMPRRFSRTSSPDLTVGFTKTGRQWPEKGWDDGYARALGETAFALCPSGDFIWTYRFFEAAAAGAIPVIEQYSPVYDGFAFHTFDDDAGRLRWSPRAARHNADLVRQRLTVPAGEMVAAIRAAITR